MSLSKEQLARLVARDIAPGSFVNLGIGLPTAVADHESHCGHATGRVGGGSCTGVP